MTSTESRWSKLREKAYREEFVAAQARRIIPFQIRAMLKTRGMTQQELANKSGLKQGVVSRAANPAYGKLALNTIIRVAAGFDVAFIGLFVPFSKLTKLYDALSEADLGDVATFDEEDAALQTPTRDDAVSAVEGATNGATSSIAVESLSTVDAVRKRMAKADLKPRQTADELEYARG
jgi:transcriptional regulator with XRE-family HTH domain